MIPLQLWANKIGQFSKLNDLQSLFNLNKEFRCAMSQTCKIRIVDAMKNTNRFLVLSCEEIAVRSGELQSLNEHLIQILQDPDDNPTELQQQERMRTSTEQERLNALLNHRIETSTVCNHNLELVSENYRNGIPDVLEGLDLEAFVPLSREHIFGCTREEEEEQWDVVPEGTEDPYIPLQRKIIFLTIQSLLEHNRRTRLIKKNIVDWVVILAHIDALASGEEFRE